MYTLLKKEISGFFSSLTGYVVIIVFLIVNSLFMWIFPGANNVLDSGYASLDTLFTIAPWVFLFLAPAVTMRMFADEKKSGTIELLLTRPISDFQIIFAKYLAGLILVLVFNYPNINLFLFGVSIRKSCWKHRHRRNLGIIYWFVFFSWNLCGNWCIVFFVYRKSDCCIHYWDAIMFCYLYWIRLHKSAHCV